MAKIRLVVNPENSLELGGVIQFAQAHRITSLKLVRCKEDNLSFELFAALHVLSNSVEDLVIESCCFIEKYQFQLLIQMFLGKMTKCRIYGTRIQHGDNVISWKSNIDYPLQDLSIEHGANADPSTDFLKFFDGCTQLQSFKTDIPRKYVEPGDQDRLPTFLARQTHLKKLSFDPTDYDLHRMSFPQLEELTLSHTKAFADDDINKMTDAIQVSTFLKTLPNLKTFDLQVAHELSPLIMEAVCNAPKLENLRIQITDDYCCCYPECKGRFQNHTVKKLRIEDDLGVIYLLLKMFLVVDSVILSVPQKFNLELSDVPYDVLEKIEFEDSSSRITVEFTPYEWPVNMESFESAVLSFASKHSERLVEIRIGDDDWCPEDFSFSTLFCDQMSHQMSSKT